MKNPQLPELWEPRLLFLETEGVQIGDKVYQVKGIETFAIFRSEESPYKLDFSIMVAP